MRKLASVRRIDAINPIQNADSIEVATVGGWRVVVKKSEFKVGDLAVYLEVDSWVPYDLAPFLSKGEPREFNGVKGERLRTVKLRGQISQGLLLPMSVAVEKFTDGPEDEGQELSEVFREGADVTDILGIQKWEAPVKQGQSGNTKGSFPSFIPKTDQERCQNLVDFIFSKDICHLRFEITEKFEGSSFTAYYQDGEVGVCSRNLELKTETEEDRNNPFVKAFFELGIRDALFKLGTNIAVQGELIGPGIQGNIYNLDKHAVAIVDWCLRT